MASPVRRILAGAAALLMLQWAALAFGAGGVPVGTGGVDSLAPAGHAEPFVLSEVGVPVTAKERSSSDKEPPPAEGVVAIVDRAETRSADRRPFIEPFGETGPAVLPARPFDARAPPIRA